MDVNELWLFIKGLPDKSSAGVWAVVNEAQKFPLSLYNNIDCTRSNLSTLEFEILITLILTYQAV